MCIRDREKVEVLCRQASNQQELVQIANDNCPGQVVISGSSNAVDLVCEYAKIEGARKARELNVSIPAHSSLMNSAQLEFNEAVTAAPINEPSRPIVSNISGKPIYSPKAIRNELNAQLTSRVRWTESILNMIDLGVQTFIELGS